MLRCQQWVRWQCIVDVGCGVDGVWDVWQPSAHLQDLCRALFGYTLSIPSSPSNPPANTPYVFENPESGSYQHMSPSTHC